ncbi:MAG: ribosome silencing factor [Clostridia bacterium]
MNSKELAQKIAAVLDTKQGEDIMVLEVSHLTSITDYFVIASAQNTIKVRAMAETVEEELEKEGIEARRKEGYQGARWVVLDYASVIVHVFHSEERAFYNIERLWMDGGNLTPFLPDDTAEKVNDAANAYVAQANLDGREMLMFEEDAEFEGDTGERAEQADLEDLEGLEGLDDLADADRLDADRKPSDDADCAQDDADAQEAGDQEEEK